MNRRNFFSKFSLLAFFVPFVPKLKSFLYDKNLEIRQECSIKYCRYYLNIPENFKKWTVFGGFDLDKNMSVIWKDENGWHNEIYDEKKHDWIVKIV